MSTNVSGTGINSAAPIGFSPFVQDAPAKPPTQPPKVAGYPALGDPAPGSITLMSITGLAFTSLLNGPVKRGDIEVGLEEVERPKKKAALNWTGTKPVRWDIPVLFDAWLDGGEVEGQVGTLVGMAQVPDDEDTSIKVRVLGIPQIGGNGGAREWFIENVTWDEDPAPLWENGLIVRQAATVSIVEAVVADQIKITPAAAARSRNGAAKVRTYVVKAGDTLEGIAARELGSASRWRDIATLNKIRDPKKISRGQKLKLP